jgi:DNA-binding PadR family transcriptional regulator
MRLPSPVELQLLALVGDERPGREVAKAYEKETGRQISYGTLYTTFRRLREAGWVSVRDGEDEDGRIRWFKITASGRTAECLARDYYQSLAAFGLRGATS